MVPVMSAMTMYKLKSTFRAYAATASFAILRVALRLVLAADMAQVLRIFLFTDLCANYPFLTLTEVLQLNQLCPTPIFHSMAHHPDQTSINYTTIRRESITLTSPYTYIL